MTPEPSGRLEHRAQKPRRNHTRRRETREAQVSAAYHRSGRSGHSAEYVVAYLRMLINQQYGGSQKKCAAAMKVSQQYLSDVLKGRRELGPSILEPLGFAARTIYIRTRGTP